MNKYQVIRDKLPEFWELDDEYLVMTIKALDKQIPRELTQMGCCPLCGEYLDDEILFITDVNYCPVCGQAFKWPEVKE